MNNSKEKIYFSIIMCCYNSEKYLKETLLSVINQTYQNFELIIIDDGSTDKTSDIIKQFIDNNKCIDIQNFHIQNSGLAAARNFGINKARYTWIAIIDHDDLWLSEKLEIQKNDILKNNSKKLFFSDFYILKNQKKESRFKIFKEKDGFDTPSLDLSKNKAFINLIINGCFIGSSTVIFNKEIIKEIGLFNKNYKFLTDYIFFIEVSKKYQLHCSSKVLSIWRNHDDQASYKMSNYYYFEMFFLYKNLILKERIGTFYNLIIIKKFTRLFISYIFNSIR